MAPTLTGRDKTLTWTAFGQRQFLPRWPTDTTVAIRPEGGKAWRSRAERGEEVVASGAGRSYEIVLRTNALTPTAPSSSVAVESAPRNAHTGMWGRSGVSAALSPSLM